MTGQNEKSQSPLTGPDIGPVMTGQLVMTGCLWPMTKIDRSYSLCLKITLADISNDRKMSDSELW